VPVLSEQITVSLPGVSTAGSRRTKAFFFNICTALNEQQYFDFIPKRLDSGVGYNPNILIH
jgi:hypothetical protein